MSEHARETPGVDAANLAVVSFWIDGAAYGVPVERVHEVIRVETITRVPHAPPHLRGLATFRGRLIPVIDLAHVLGRPAPAITRESRIVTVAVAGRLLGLLVERAAAVTTVAASFGEPHSAAGPLIATTTWQGCPLGILDVDHVAETS